MSIKNKLKYWLIPQAFEDLYTFKIKDKLKQKEVAAETVFSLPETNKNIAFKNIHKGERCFILASGPSINEQDLTPLKNEKCIAVSSFFHHKDIDIIRPQYHVLAAIHPPFTFKEVDIILKGFERQYKYPLDLFLGTTAA